MIIAQCRLCMKNEKLIKAHIIPKSLFAQNNYLISDSSNFIKQRPRGACDDEILCEKCDNVILGDLDTYAKEVLIDRKGVTMYPIRNPESENQALNLYRLCDKSGYDKLNRFFISVLWRASISSKNDFINFSLGFHENTAKMAILNPEYDCSDIFSVAISLLTDLPAPINLVTHKFTRIEGVNFYFLIIGFYKVLIKVDKRKLPVKLRSIILSSENDILMCENNFSEIPEYKTVRNMVEKYGSINKSDYKVKTIWENIQNGLNGKN